MSDRPAAVIPLNRRIYLMSMVTLMSCVAAFGFPMLDRALNPGSSTPSVLSFAGVGLSVLLLTAVLLVVGLRGVLPRSQVFLAAMVGYNALLVVIKFGLGPFALYVQSEANGFLVLNTAGSSIAFLAFPAVAAVTAILYGGAFFLLYLYFNSRLRQRLGVNVRLERGFVSLLITMFVIGVAGAITGLGAFDFLEYLFSFLAFPVLAALLALALVAALTLAAVAFREATEQAVLMRNVTALSTFAWIGLAFIAAYHIVWLVFVLTLVALFPLKSMNVK